MTSIGVDTKLIFGTIPVPFNPFILVLKVSLKTSAESSPKLVSSILTALRARDLTPTSTSIFFVVVLYEELKNPKVKVPSKSR